MAGHHHTTNAETRAQLTCVLPSRTAKSDQDELARVVAAFHGDAADGALHAGVHDPHHSFASLLTRAFECHRNALDRRARPRGVQTHASTEKGIREETAEHQIGVGHGRCMTASVTCWTWIGASALRTYLERA